MKLQFAACLLFLISKLSMAQIGVENPSHLEFPQQRAQLLQQIICRVVAEELHVRSPKADLPVTLVLGQAEERIGVDQDGIPSKIYLHRWNEATFAISDMQLHPPRRHLQP
jgi:hypothetical protein